MKKALKIYGRAWVVLIAVTIVTFAVMIIFPSHHELAADPYSIEKIVKVDLPEPVPPAMPIMVVFMLISSSDLHQS